MCFKKTVLVIVFFLFCQLNVMCVYGDDIYEGGPDSEVFLSDVKDKGINPPVIDAAAAIVMDMNSRRILYSKNANTRRSIASTTKIMTAIVALEKGNMDDTVTVSKRAAEIWGSNIGLKVGEKLKLKELLYGLMLNSGNDAAIAIAEHIGGSVENFAVMMNEKAEELGLKDTSFRTPHGLDADGHYSSAYDLALMARYALAKPIFAEIVSTVCTQIPGRSLYNTNEMLGYYNGADGVKTGYTGKAGRCLVCSATRNNWRIISVVLGCSTRTVRSDSSRRILDYAFNNYKSYTLVRVDEKIKNIPVIKGKLKSVSILAVDEIKIPLKNDELSRLKIETDLPDSFNAPVSRNVEAGKIQISLDGKVIAESALKTGDDVKHKDIFDYFRELLYVWEGLMRLGMD